MTTAANALAISPGAMFLRPWDEDHRSIRPATVHTTVPGATFSD